MKKDINKIIDSYILSGVTESSLKVLFKELNLNLDNFHEWINGQTVMMVGGETVYFTDDVKRFIKGLKVID